MKYKSGEEPLKLDAVMGAIAEIPCRGKVIRIGKDSITIERRGAAVRDPRSKHFTPGPIEHLDVQAEDFSLIYRKEVS